MRHAIPVILLCLGLSACEKPSHGASSGADPCANAKGTPPYETDAQVVQACRDNKKFSGRDAKRSNIQITNH